MKKLSIILFILLFISCKKSTLPLDFNNSALLVVDIQVGKNPGKLIDTKKEIDVKDVHIPTEWAKTGIKPEDIVNAAKFDREIAFPNSLKTVRFFANKNLPIIYLRWGTFHPKALDMEPIVRKYHVQYLGDDPKKWGIFDIQIDPSLTEISQGIEVVKTGHDGFMSSNLDFVLRNLGIKKLYMIGGHTNACYLTTAQSAKKKEYTTISIEDATTDAAESRRLMGIEKAKFDYIIKTKDLETIK